MLNAHWTARARQSNFHVTRREATGAQESPDGQYRGTSVKQLSGMDNMFLHLEHGNQYMHVAGLGIYDPSTAPGGFVRFKDILKFFESRLDTAPVFRRRLVTVPLDLDRPYRFRMLAADVTHGASIQFGEGARMIRLGPGAETELQMTFTRPGSFLVYCTSYCGPGHDGMQARITVV
jgi:hypothetical protein